MIRLPALLLLALPLAAQTAPATPAEPAPAAPPPSSPTSSVEVSRPTSHVSSTMATAIHAKLPRFAPPPPPPPPQPETENPEGEEVDDPSDTSTGDRPKNKIIRLPRYVVYGQRPAVFRERDIYTRQGLAALAMKRYLSSLDRNVLNRFTLPLIGTSAEARAMQIYEEQARLQNIADFQSAAADAERAGDKQEADYLRRTTNDTYLRTGGMNWNSWKRP